MNQFGIYFAGRSILLPGVYARVNADAMTPRRGAPSRAIAILATAQGGTVSGTDKITSLAAVRDTLIGGIGAQLTELAMAPSGEVQGAGEVYFVRVNKAVAATLDHADVVFTSRVAGKVGNSARAKRSAVTAGAFTLDLEHLYLGLAEQYTDLGPAFRLEYVGAEVSPTAVVSDDAGVKTLTLTGASTVALSSDNIATIDALIDEINNTSEWTASARGSLTALQTADLTVGSITLTSEVGIATIDPNTAIALALAGSGIASAVAVDDTADFAADEWTYFSGGTEGAPVATQDWLDALDIAADLDVIGVVMGTGELAPLAAAKAHVETLSDAKNRKERLLYCGPVKAASKTALLDSLQELSLGIGGKRTVIAGTEPKLVAAGSNTVEVYPAFYAAAMAAGMKAGNRPEMPLTNKQVSIFGTSYQYDVDDLEGLLAMGVMPIHLDVPTGDHVITQGITSWTRDANVIYRKIAGMDIADYLNRIIRAGLHRFIGKVGDVLTAQMILNTVIGVLDAEVRGANNPDGVLTPGTNDDGTDAPAYADVEVELDGFDLVGIRYRAHPVGEIAYIIATAYLTPVRIVARQ
jgi:hypothetical protein